MTDSTPDTSQQRASVDPEARDSLIHRVQVTQLLRIGSALGVGVLVAALAPGWRDDGARDLRPWPRPLPGAVSVSDHTPSGWTLLLAELTAAGVWSQTSSSTLAFTPTHVGLAGEAAGDGAGYLDFRDLIIEEFV